MMSVSNRRAGAMRITKEQARQNHDRVVAAASELFRARGFEDVRVSEITGAAGLTHGGFYNHFESKDDLALQALDSAFSQMAAERAKSADLAEMLTLYLSQASRRGPGKSCPAAALAGEVGRGDEGLKAVFAHGLEGMIRSVEAGLPATAAGNLSARERAVGVVVRMIGALALSRAVPGSSGLGDELR